MESRNGISSFIAVTIILYNPRHLYLGFRLEKTREISGPSVRLGTLRGDESVSDTTNRLYEGGKKKTSKEKKEVLSRVFFVTFPVSKRRDLYEGRTRFYIKDNRRIHPLSQVVTKIGGGAAGRKK